MPLHRDPVGPPGATHVPNYAGLAEIFLRAQRSGGLASPSAPFRNLSLEAGYEIGAALARRRVGAGWNVAGWKVGFTNRALWRRWGLDRPIVAPVYRETVVDAGDYDGNPDSGPVPVPRTDRRPEPHLALSAGALAQPRVEVEAVFGFGTPTESGGVTGQTPAWVALGAELVDCHYPGWSFGPGAAVADFGLHAALAVGPRVTPVPAGLLDALSGIAVSLSAGGKTLAAGRGRSVLGGPAKVLAALEGPLAERVLQYRRAILPAEPPRAAMWPAASAVPTIASATRDQRGVRAPSRTAAASRDADPGVRPYLVSTGTFTPLVEARIGTVYQVRSDLLPSFTLEMA